MNDKVAVLINSCDNYVDILDYFFYFFNRFWRCPYKIYLNMETIDYYSVNLEKTFTFGKIPWSNRLIKCLEEMDEDYVITFLDDFFLTDIVDQNRLDDCVYKMCEDNLIGYHMFQPHCSNLFNVAGEDNSFRIRDKHEKYLSSAQICLWRKNYLLQVLRKRESPWDFERYGTLRMRHYKQKLYVLSPDSEPIFNYEFRGDRAAGLVSGKWHKGNLALFKEHNLYCDFTKRGIFDPNEITTYKSIVQRYQELTRKRKLLLPIVDINLFFSYFKLRLKSELKEYVSRIDIIGRFKNYFC